MMLALCLPIFLYSLSNRLPFINKFFLTLFFVILSLSLYQASIGAYVELALIELCHALLANSSQQQNLKQFIIRLLGIIVGTVFYMVIIAHPLLKGYGAERSSLLPLFTDSGYRQMMRHIFIYYSRYQIFFHSTHKIIRILYLFIYIGGTGIVLKKLWCNANKNMFTKSIYSCLFVFLPAILLVGSVIPFALLKAPVFAPRMYLSFTVFFMYMAILLYQLELKFPFAMIVLIPMILFGLSFSAGYGNLLYHENQHDQYIAQSIANDLNQLENQQNKIYKKITFIGKEPECLELKRQKVKRPLMALLVPIYMNNDWLWGSTYLDHYRKTRTSLESKKTEDTLLIDTHSALSRNEFYDFYDAGNKAIVVFRD